jgi:predicted dienelactone hydrolase
MRPHALIGKAKNLLVPQSTPVLSVSPIVLSIPTRLADLELKVSVPTTGSNLPIILLSHGHGASNNLSSLNGYGPLANFWASHGFAVFQPTHLSSKTYAFDAKTPGAPLFWKSRVEDMKHILDQLDNIEAAFPAIKGRLDRSRVAVVGHSLGSHTASMLLGQTLLSPEDGKVVDMREPRITTGVLLTAIGNGNGGKDLSAWANENAPVFKNNSFAEMKTPTLVVVGDKDVSPHLTPRGADWHADPYTSSTGPKSLLTFNGAGHLLGGISGYDAHETATHDTENIEMVALVERLTWAYLRSALYPEDKAWISASAAFEDLKDLGKIESK